MFRLDQEKDNASFYYWLTLQYDNDHVPKIIAQEPYEAQDEFGLTVTKWSEPREEMCFSKEHCHNFFEKLRKRYSKDGITFKHFLVSEYGPNRTHRPHYHCLLLVYSENSLKKNIEIRNEMKDFIIHKAWPHGFVCEKSYHGRVLSYLTKYCLKPELLGQYHTMKPFTLISKGIGLCFLDNLPDLQIQQMIDKLDFTYRYGSGKIQLPRYYVDKIFPHSLDALRKTLPDDPQGDWSSYIKLNNKRQRLLSKQNALTKLQAIKRIDESYEDRENFRQYEMAKFRSKVESRKNL